MESKETEEWGRWETRGLKPLNMTDAGHELAKAMLSRWTGKVFNNIEAYLHGRGEGKIDVYLVADSESGMCVGILFPVLEADYGDFFTDIRRN